MRKQQNICHKRVVAGWTHPQLLKQLINQLIAVLLRLPWAWFPWAWWSLTIWIAVREPVSSHMSSNTVTYMMPPKALQNCTNFYGTYAYTTTFNNFCITEQLKLVSTRVSTYLHVHVIVQIKIYSSQFTVNFLGKLYFICQIDGHLLVLPNIFASCY